MQDKEQNGELLLLSMWSLEQFLFPAALLLPPSPIWPLSLLFLLRLSSLLANKMTIKMKWNQEQNRELCFLSTVWKQVTNNIYINSYFYGLLMDEVFVYYSVVVVEEKHNFPMKQRLILLLVKNEKCLQADNHDPRNSGPAPHTTIHSHQNLSNNMVQNWSASNATTMEKHTL